MMSTYFAMAGLGGSGQVPPPNPIVYDYDIFIDFGQSNIDGRNLYAEKPSFIQADGTLLGVKMWNVYLNQFDLFKLGTNSGGETNNSDYWAFDIVAHYYIRQNIGRDTLVIKQSKGGTALAIGVNALGCWNTDFDSIPIGQRRLLQELQLKIATVTSYLDSINKTYRFRAMLFHQGESDGDGGAPSQSAYYANFTNIIAYLRSIIGLTVPIIYGTIPNASASYSATIEAAHLQVASEDENAYCVDLSGLTLSDPYHFDSASSIYFGEQVANIFINNNL